MYTISKAVAFLLHPAHLAIVLTVLAAGASAAGRRPTARAGYLGAAVVVFISFATPLGDHLLWRLENRIARPKTLDLPAHAGAIILGGGAEAGAIAEARDTYFLREAGERLTTILELRAQDPDFYILFSGGSSTLRAPSVPEADVVRRFLVAMGRDPEGIDYEERSRNTFENAIYSAEHLAGRPGRYVLVTSAAHMPRALGAFRKAGLDVTPYPVDYRQWPPQWTVLDITYRRANRLADALREYVGLLAYYALGRTDALFPDDRR